MATYPTEYAHPEALVETDWLEKHLNDAGIRIVESNEDILLYDTGHIPGAVHIDWRADLQDPLIRDYISPEKFARLCSRHGITPETTCIFYGDKANWWACYALWAFRLFGHDKVKILNGGRDKWKAEGRRMTREVPEYPGTDYPVPKKRFDKEIRAFFDEALTQSKTSKPLIDVRSPGEYRGEITHMPEYPQEGVLRAGKFAMPDDSSYLFNDVLIYPHQSHAGPMTEAELWATAPVWKSIHDHYTPDANVVAQLRAAKPARVTIVFATWCGDSKRAVPRLLKALHEANNPLLQVDLYGIGPDFLTPLELVRDERLTNVPTMIVERGRKEIGRVVETPAAAAGGAGGGSVLGRQNPPAPGRRQGAHAAARQRPLRAALRARRDGDGDVG